MSIRSCANPWRFETSAFTASAEWTTLLNVTANAQWSKLLSVQLQRQRQSLCRRPRRSSIATTFIYSISSWRAPHYLTLRLAIWLSFLTTSNPHAEFGRQ